MEIRDRRKDSLLDLAEFHRINPRIIRSAFLYHFADGGVFGVCEAAVYTLMRMGVSGFGMRIGIALAQSEWIYRYDEPP